ncbi:MAG: hypothetical protein BRC44_07615 [Cyanobacteria bacterium QS_4_48_99]|nr:MAG: hypothetical protein BRC44_07615 [Cyanobacteria bacterium QS_4_48_99]
MPVESERNTRRKRETTTPDYLSELPETTQSFAARMGGNWGLEKQLHYLRDLSPAEDQSRIRTTPLPPMGVLARNVAMNLDRDAVFTNMAQAQGKCGLGLEQV